jgi:CRP-like cAMP-binding protein
MIGQDDILLERDRQYSFIADSECFTMRLDADHFRKILSEDPEIKEKLWKEC